MTTINSSEKIKVNLSVKEWIGLIIFFLTIISSLIYGYADLRSNDKTARDNINLKVDKSEYEKKCIKDSMNSEIILNKIEEINKDTKRILRKLER